MDPSAVLEKAPAAAATASIKTTSPDASRPPQPRIDVPAIADSQRAKSVWYGVLEQIAPSQTVVLDMTHVTAVDRASIAALVGFVKAVSKRNSKLVMCNLPKETQAMLELLGVHYVVEFRG